MELAGFYCGPHRIRKRDAYLSRSRRIAPLQDSIMGYRNSVPHPLVGLHPIPPRAIRIYSPPTRPRHISAALYPAHRARTSSFREPRAVSGKATDTSTMNLKRLLLLATTLVGCSLLPAQSERSHEDFGAEKTIQNLNHVIIQNGEGEKIGRVRGINLDLANGRIVELFVVSGEFLGLGGKVTAVPISRIVTSYDKEIYYLDATMEQFKSSPAVNLSSSNGDYSSAGRIAANYRHFGVDPYFSEPGNSSPQADGRSKRSLGHIERANKILGLPVGNLQGVPFGTVAGINFNVAKARISSVIVRAPGAQKATSVIPAASLDFNSARNGLLLDDTKREFANQPRIVVTPAANGQPATSVEEPFVGEDASVATTQGTSYSDIDLRATISRQIRAANIRGLSSQVTAEDGRVTLRGTATTEDAKTRAGEIAVAASRLEKVDNQIVVNPSR
jgi:sporulation protein YlmC with PRC-barrel domain